MTTENKYKVGDLVLVEAEVEYVSDQHGDTRLRTEAFGSPPFGRMLAWSKPERVHPMPSLNTPTLTEIDCNAGDGEGCGAKAKSPLAPASGGSSFQTTKGASE